MYFVITEKKIIEFCNFCNLFELRSEFVTRGHPYKIFKRHCSCTARSSLFLSVLLIFGTVYLTYNLLNSSNKRACSNTFVHVTLVSSTHNNEQKLQENVKSDTRKLIKHLKKKFKNGKTTHTKQEHTHVKNLKRQLMTKDFLWRLKLHVGNWNDGLWF